MPVASKPVSEESSQDTQTIGQQHHASTLTSDRLGRTTRRSTKARKTSKLFSMSDSRLELLLGFIGIVALLVAWEAVSRLGFVSPKAIPPPSEVAITAADLLSRGNFWLATWQTVWATLLGMVAIIAIAVPVAIAIHSSRTVEESTWFIIEFLKPIPGVALIPLALLVWGPTAGIKVGLIVFGGLWPLLTQLVYGLKETSGVAISMSKVYQFTAWQKFRYLTLPSLMPFALTGLRISITIALIVAIVTEYIVGISGLGLLLSTAQLNGLIDQTYALLFFSGVLGLLASGLIAALSRPLLFWHPSQREK